MVLELTQNSKINYIIPSIITEMNELEDKMSENDLFYVITTKNTLFNV